MVEKKKTTKATAKKAVSQAKTAPKKVSTTTKKTVNSAARKVNSTTKKAVTAANKTTASTVKTTNNNLASATNKPAARQRSGGRWPLFLIPLLLLVAAGAWFASSYVKTDSNGDVYISNTRRFDANELKELKTGAEGLTYGEVVARYGEPTKKIETNLGNVRTVTATWKDDNGDDKKETGVVLYFQGSGDLNDLHLVNKIGTYDTESSKKSSSSSVSSVSSSSK